MHEKHDFIGFGSFLLNLKTHSPSYPKNIPCDMFGELLGSLGPQKLDQDLNMKKFVFLHH